MRLRPIDLVDVFVYLVVLGVFSELFPRVISETFLLALLTAVLLKVVLELVLVVKKRVVARIRAAPTPVGRVVNALSLVLVMAGSKFLVLELTALAFGDFVQLGGLGLGDGSDPDPDAGSRRHAVPARANRPRGRRLNRRPDHSG